jgi:NADH-quinone oxidoreductase subunit M
MGGFWNAAPRMGGITLIFVLASLGLPGLGNFVAEFLILAGAFQVNVVASIIATLGLIASAIYGLYLMQKVFFGTKPDKHLQLKDFNVREMVAGLSLVIIIVWIGLFPGIFLKIMDGQTEYKQHPEEFMQTKSDVKYQSTRENSSEIIPVTRKKQKPE